MQLGIGKTLFPSWAAALTLVKEHGVDAGQHAQDAVRAGSAAARLDSAVRAMTSFDHTIDNTSKLPVSWFVKSAPAYYRGYEAAKQAVTLLVASGVIPGAKERVGRQSMLAAKETFLAGVEAARADRSRFGTKLASGWLEATAEDALAGAAMLRPGGNVGQSLLAGIAQVRSAVAARRAVDEQLVSSVTRLFDQAGSQLNELVASAGTRSAQASAADMTQVMARSEQLLSEAATAARDFVASLPGDEIFEQLPVAG